MEARESAEHGLRSSSRPAPKGAAPLDPKDPSYPPKIREVLAKGQTTWLKNTEVCDLLLNFQAYNMRVSRDPPLQPPGGSLFLYDRRAVRFFRKDRHNWRKKADGKTVRETHEKLKVGNVDMLNCYYAHADQDDSLQRRCYWLLESDEDIVLVHYLNVERERGSRATKQEDAPAVVPERQSRRLATQSQSASEGTGQPPAPGLGQQTKHAQRPAAAQISLSAAVADRPPAEQEPYMPLLPSMSLDSFFAAFDDQNPAMQRMQRAPSDTLLGLDPILPGWDELAPGHSMEAALPLGLDWRGGSFLKDEVLGDVPADVPSHMVQHGGSMRIIEQRANSNSFAQNIFNMTHDNLGGLQQNAAQQQQHQHHMQQAQAAFRSNSGRSLFGAQSAFYAGQPRTSMRGRSGSFARNMAVQIAAGGFRQPGGFNPAGFQAPGPRGPPFPPTMQAAAQGQHTGHGQPHMQQPQQAAVGAPPRQRHTSPFATAAFSGQAVQPLGPRPVRETPSFAGVGALQQPSGSASEGSAFGNAGQQQHQPLPPPRQQQMSPFAGGPDRQRQLPPFAADPAGQQQLGHGGGGQQAAPFGPARQPSAFAGPPAHSAFASVAGLSSFANTSTLQHAQTAFPAMQQQPGEYVSPFARAPTPGESGRASPASAMDQDGNGEDEDGAAEMSAQAALHGDGDTAVAFTREYRRDQRAHQDRIRRLVQQNWPAPKHSGLMQAKSSPPGSLVMPWDNLQRSPFQTQQPQPPQQQQQQQQQQQAHSDLSPNLTKLGSNASQLPASPGGMGPSAMEQSEAGGAAASGAPDQQATSTSSSSRWERMQSPFASSKQTALPTHAPPASQADWQQKFLKHKDGSDSDSGDVGGSKAKHQAFKTSKALALEQELCNLDRQVMEQLMSRRPTPGMATNPHMALVDEQVRAWENQINELESSSAQIAPMRVEARPGMIVEQLSGDLKHSSEDSADPAGRQSPSQSSQDDMAVPVRSTGRAHDRMEDTASRAQNPLEAQGSVSRRAFELLDYTPDWDFCVGGAKMIISGAMQEENNMQDGAAQLFVSFDGQEVPAKILGPGVLRCHVPPHEPGSIKVVVTRGDGKPCSKSFAFEYRLLPRSARGNEERTVDALSDRDLQGRLINMLLGSRRAATGTTSDAGTSSHTSANTASGKAGASSDGSRERQRASGTGDAALDQQVDDMEHLDEEKRERLLMTLLEREMKRFIAEVLKQKDAAQKQSAGTGRSDRSVELLVNQLSPAGVALLHYCAALGFDWAVLMLLSVGANIALKDAWGYQPLHWAAARGQEATVAMLVARNAQPTAMTFPTESQPALTAADLASQNGHSGIAAYLAEVALNQSLQKMHMATSTDSQAGSGAPSADGTGRAVITMQRKRSRHHDYLDDVLGSPFGAKPSMSAESAGSQRGQPEAGPEASSGKQPDELDATAVAAAAKKAAEMIQAANRRFAQRRTVRDTRRQRLQKREDAALARIQDSVKTWTDVQTIADTQVLSDTRQPPDPLLLRYLHLGKRITRLNTTLRCTLQAPASGGSDSEKKEAENEHEEVSDGRRGHSGELEDYGSDTDVQMCRSNSLLTMHQARRALRSGRGGGIGGARPERRPRRPASAALPHIPTSPDMDTHVAVHHVEGIVRSPAARAQYLRLKEATSHLAVLQPWHTSKFARTIAEVDQAAAAGMQHKHRGLAPSGQRVSVQAA